MQRPKRPITLPRRYKHTSSDADKYKQPKKKKNKRSLEQTLSEDIADIKKTMQAKVQDTAVDSENSGSCSYETDSQDSDKAQSSSKFNDYVYPAQENYNTLVPSNINDVDNRRSFSDTQSFRYAPLQTFQPNYVPSSTSDSNNSSRSLYIQYTNNKEGAFYQSRNGNSSTQTQSEIVLPATTTMSYAYSHETPAYSSALSCPTQKKTQLSEYPPESISEPVENYTSRENATCTVIHKEPVKTAISLSHNSAILDEIRYA